MGALFGPAGGSAAFSAQYKSSLDMPKYLAAMGLTAFEYQCGRGVTIQENSAKKLGEAAREYGISLSIHAPYFISMSSEDEVKRLQGSLRYFMESAAAAKAMGASRIVFHSGSCAKMPRKQALALAKDTLLHVLAAYDEAGFSEITLCPETMGKMNQLGTLEEVIALCRLDERLIPCIDFGHVNARSQGGLQTEADIHRIIDALEAGIGVERTKKIHSHFSKIEFSAGGEVRHLTFEDTLYGPEFSPVAAACVKRGLSPIFICESAGTQDIDAAAMQQAWLLQNESFYSQST